MSLSLQKPLVAGTATTNSRIQTAQQTTFKTAIFQHIFKALLKHNPRLDKSKTVFLQIFVTGKNRARLPKFALPVSIYLISLFRGIENMLSNTQDPHSESNLSQPVLGLLSSFSIPLDCFFASDEKFFAKLNVSTRTASAVISIVDTSGLELFRIDDKTGFNLTFIPGDLSYCPPEPICSLSPPSSSFTRQLSVVEVDKRNIVIESKNNATADQVRTTLSDKTPLPLPDQASPSLPPKSNHPKVTSNKSALCEPSEPSMPSNDLNPALKTFDKNYKITDYWV